MVNLLVVVIIRIANILNRCKNPLILALNVLNVIKAKLLKRRSRRGKIFFSCARYPDCKYAIWNEPVNRPCPKCAWPMLTIKVTKKRGTELVCPRQTCGFVEQVEEDVKL